MFSNRQKCLFLFGMNIGMSMTDNLAGPVADITIKAYEKRYDPNHSFFSGFTIPCFVFTCHIVTPPCLRSVEMSIISSDEISRS